MEITLLGHSCFRLRSDDLAIITDPFPDSIGLHMGEPRAVAITISHRHPNHAHEGGVAGNPKVLRGPGEYELSGIYITGIMTPRGENDPSDKRNTTYLLEMENLRLCHLGDINNGLSTRQVEELRPVDVLFMPVGGVCTLQVPRVIDVMRSLDPRVVIPMHYGRPGLRVELGSLDDFFKEMGLRDVEPQTRLSISPSNVPQEMRTVVLEPQGQEVQDQFTLI